MIIKIISFIVLCVSVFLTLIHIPLFKDSKNRPISIFLFIYYVMSAIISMWVIL